MKKRLPSVNVTQLQFDLENPRLPQSVEKTEDSIMKYLTEEVQIQDIIDSMSSVGFIEADPIIVKENEDDSYTVIEGNRRLAALRWLTGYINPEIRSPVLPAEIEESILQSFKAIPVSTGWDDAELASYLGYKHVTSTREWSPLAKARFVIAHCNQNFQDDNLKQFAKSMGSNLPTLKKWLSAYFALRQGVSQGVISEEEAEGIRFGVFYTLLGSTVVKEFVGIDASSIKLNPATDERALADLLKWTIGDKKSVPIINSRDQKALESIIKSPRALEFLRETSDLEAAKFHSDFQAEEIASQFRKATYSLEKCLRVLNDAREDPLILDAYHELKRAFKKVALNLQVED